MTTTITSTDTTTITTEPRRAAAKEKADRPSDAADCSAYLDDSVTVGELIRWMNAQVRKAAKAADFDMARATALSTDNVESAWRVYRSANPLPTF